MTGRQGRRCKELLDDRKGKRSDCELKDGALVHTSWRIHF
jgi:hypothetical protein